MEKSADPASTLPAVVTTEDADRILKSRADLSYRLFDGVELHGSVARQSIFPGALFRRCVISDCDFSRSDFEGTRFDQCTLKNVSFEDADIRSTQFTECVLEECSFVGSYFSRNLVVGGTLDACHFDRSTVLNNEFRACILRRMTNQVATILHTDFVAATFQGVSLANCTCLYSYFEDCIYDEFEINADAVGLSFGLPEAALENARLVFLGRAETPPPGAQVVDGLLQEFSGRGWQLHTALAQLNFGRVRPLAGWLSLFEVFFEEASLKRITKADDTAFVMHIAERMARRQQLPMFAIIAAYDRTSDLPDEVSAADGPATGGLSALRTNLSGLLLEMEAAYFRGAADVSGVPLATAVTAELEFAQRPAEPVVPFIEALSAAARIPQYPVHQLGARPGSWIEIVQGSLGTMLALYAALYLVEGYLARLTAIKARLKVLRSEGVPKGYLARARDPAHDPTREMLEVLGNAYSAILKGTITIPSDSAIVGRNLNEIRVTEPGSPSP